MRTKFSVFCDRVIEAGWLAAVIIVPLFFNIYSQRVFEPDKLSLLRSIALVMVVAWLLRLVEDRRTSQSKGTGAAPAQGSLWRRVARTPLVLPTLLLVAVYLISTAASVVPRVSLLGSYQRLQGTYTTLSYIVIFFLALQNLRTKRQMDRLITVMILVSFPIALYGLIQHFDLDPLPWGGDVSYRVASNLGNAIFVAAFLIMAVPLTLSRLLEKWREAAGGFASRDLFRGGLAFVLLAGALLVGMLLGRGEAASWMRWVALLIGVGLQAPIYLLTPAERRPRVLAISLPLTFGFLVGFSWILEIFFPPASSSYFWLGLLASGIFIVAMAAFAYYLRKPLSSLLLLSAYFVILLAQVICIFYSQSRGPLLGLFAGLFFYLALLGLIKRRIWVPWAMTGVAAVVVVLLLVFNLVESPAIDSLRKVPYVGRLGTLLQTESGTGKVRILIWEGALQMISPHAPLEVPGEEAWADPLNVLRPAIGYGPESMYVAYNRFYPPDLAHYERRNASPDRSHNETFDALVTTGTLGFLIYMFVFVSVFYYGLKWLGLIQLRWQKWLFVALWIGGGFLGAVVTWLWRGPPYIGLGIPLGTTLGLAIYLFSAVLAATLRPGKLPTPGGDYALPLLALVSAILAHFVEIHFGIAIAATRTYFWVFAAMIFLIGTQLASPAGQVTVEAAPVAQTAGHAGSGGQKTASHRRRRGAAAAPQPQSRMLRLAAHDWQGELLVLSLVALLVLGTLLFDFVTVQTDASGVLPTIWSSLTRSQERPVPVILVLILATWGMIGLVGLGTLAAGEESKGKKAGAWWTAIGVFALISLGGALLFSLLHAVRLKPVTIASADAPNPLANTITFYYLFVAVLILGLALALTFLFRQQFKPSRWSGELGDFGLAALAVLLPVVAGILIVATNLSIVRADVLYKQGLSSEKAQQWDGALFFYQKAVDMAKDQDFYYLFLGRAYLEKAKDSKGGDQEQWLAESERELLKAREIAPLNTDHSANLARLYRTWGGLSQGERRTELLNKALGYYRDATSLSPNNAGLYNEWGQTYAVLGDQDQALQMYQKSLSLDDRYEQTHLLLGEFYMQQKDWDQAVNAYRRAVEIRPPKGSLEANSALGYVYTQKGDLESALQAYQTAVELSPRNYNDRKNLAILYQQMGQIDNAIQEAQQALELAPEDQKTTIEAFLAQLGQLQSGVSAEDAQKLQQLLDEGSAKMNTEDWAAAESSYEQALELDSGNIQAHSALAYIYAKQGRTEEAIAENLVVTRLLPSDYNSHKNLALLYQQKGEIAQAITFAEAALKLAPEGEKTAFEAYLNQLKSQQQGVTPAAASPSGERSGDLAPAQRNGYYSSPPEMGIDPGRAYQATIVTERGDIVVALYADRAPNTVNNFVFLARQGFYDNTTFHRVLPGFMAQGGDPSGTGRGGPGYAFADEFDSSRRHDGPGILSMANAGANTNGSQFFITYVATPWLDDRHTVFGRVTEGLEVLEALTPRDPQQNPSFAGDAILTIIIEEK